MKKSKKSLFSWNTLALLLVGSLILFVIFLNIRKPKPESEEAENESNSTDTGAGNGLGGVIQADSGSIKETFDKALKEIPFLSNNAKKLIKAIAAHETGNFTSDLALKSNNFFGMHMPMRRETTAIGATSNNYAIYRDAKDSINDFLKWFKFHGVDKKSFNTFPKHADPVKPIVYFMANKGYFTDSKGNYYMKVKYWYEHEA